MALADIYQKATLVQIPSGYKAADAELYSVVPNTTAGDFTVSVDADATRVNKDGLIESVAANQARLDYDPTNPQDPHLLLEPSRTNNILQSNDPSGANWTDPLSRWTLLSNTTTAPDGGTVRIIELTESGGSLIRLTGLSIAAGTYTVSFYIKDIDGNLTGGNVDIGDEGSGVPSPAFGDVGSDWVRATRTITTTATKSYMDLQPTFSGSTNKVAIWGVQLEAGSYDTSLIPTSGSVVTRTVDTCKLENFADIPTSYPFTAFVDMDVIEDETGYGFSILDISSDSLYWSVGYSEDSGNLGKFRFTNRAQGTAYNFNTISTYGTGRYKVAIKFISATNFKAFIDGVEVADYTHTSSAFNTNIDDILLGQLRVSGDVNTRNTVYQFMLFNEALSDSELQTLTS